MNTKKYFSEIFSENPNQDHVIDGIRGCSVISIIAFHVTVGILQIYDHEKAKQFILSMPIWLQPLWHGEKGVDAFFLISALVLGIPLLRKIETFSWTDGIAFYKKRFFRIYPLFFFALLLYTAGQYSYFGKYFMSNALLINNLIPEQRTIIPVGWSLLVEVQYYALIPILFFGIKRIRTRGLALAGLFLSSILVCAGILYFNPFLYERPLTDLFLAADHDFFSKEVGALFYESDAARFGPFALGLYLSYLRVFKNDELKRLFIRVRWSWLFFILAATMILFSVTVPLYNPESWFYSPFSTALNFIVLSTHRQIFSFGLFCVILGCWYGKGPFLFINRILKTGVLRPFSRLSFPIYLFHFPFIAIAAVLVFQTTNVKEVLSVSAGQASLIFLLAAALTLLFSIPLYIFIERPFIELFRNKPKTIV